jgi:peptide/nickel transport system substrate-binding protein
LFVLGSDAAPLFAALRGADACARSPSSCNLSAGVRTDDRAGSVILRLTRPDPDLLFKLALAPARPVPPGTPRTTLSSAPVPSTGPYRVESLVPDRRLLLVRNGRFHAWSRAAQPDGYPDRIYIQMQPDAGARIRAVLDGQADIALEVAAAPLGAVRTQHASQLHRHTQPHTSFFNFNVQRPPFDDVRARQAVNLALDRAAIARRFGGPFISTPTCQILPPRFPGRHGYCPWTRGRRDGRWHAPDLARARALVRASGTEGLPVTFLTNSDDTAGRAGAGPLASALRSIGYRPRIIVAHSDPAFGEQIANLRSGWNISSGDWTADYPSPGEFFGVFLACSSYRPDDPAQTTNSGGFCDPKLDRLLARAQTLQTSNPVAADALWAQADRLAVDQAAWAPMVNNAAVEVLSTRVGDFTLDANSLPQIDQLWVQ